MFKSFKLTILIILSFIFNTTAITGSNSKSEKLYDLKDSNTISFSVEVQELSVNYNQFFAIAMPDELLEFDVQVPPSSKRKFTFEAPLAQEILAGPTALAWKAPKEPGVYHVNITAEDSKEQMKLNVFVMRPLTEVEDGHLNGYRIGQYPDKALRSDPKYLAPAGLIEYTDELKNLAISPNFNLKQFLCKQTSNSEHKYLLVKPSLVLKLEKLISEVKKRKITIDNFFIMSGYRTPYYNKSIGNVKYSRHAWGDAADIYIDVNPKNGNMDDINADGVVNRKDAAYLYDIADEMNKVMAALGLSGGIGEYKANSVHGPFLHIDTRGYKARWGR